MAMQHPKAQVAGKHVCVLEARIDTLRSSCRRTVLYLCSSIQSTLVVKQTHVWYGGFDEEKEHEGEGEREGVDDVFQRRYVVCNCTFIHNAWVLYIYIYIYILYYIHYCV
jgi:hypothetical protein